MVGLVLGDPCRETLERQLQRLAVAIQRANGDVGPAWHHAADVRDAEAPLPTLGRRVTNRHDLGVDDHRGVRFRTRILLEQRHEDSNVLVHLRPGQADAVVLVHRLDHVVDELLQQHVPQLRRLHGSRAFPQHGMSHARDFQNGHEGRL